jgi:hypothetical protein
MTMKAWKLTAGSLALTAVLAGPCRSRPKAGPDQDRRLDVAHRHVRQARELSEGGL